jgi:aspartate/methionine/tyrosine aminotransferase
MDAGAVADLETLRSIARVAEQAGIHVLVDEVYLDTPAAPGVASAATVCVRVIVTSSLTKCMSPAVLEGGLAALGAALDAAGA